VIGGLLQMTQLEVIFGGYVSLKKNTILSYSPYLICSWIAIQDIQDWDSERQVLQNPQK
jgi:hypothetical protein